MRKEEKILKDFIQMDYEMRNRTHNTGHKIDTKMGVYSFPECNPLLLITAEA